MAKSRLASDNAAFENNCVKTNKDRPTLSAVQIFRRYSSFWRYKVYADIRKSLEMRRQTTVWSRVNPRAAVACILAAKVYSLCANKSAGSLDVGVGHYGEKVT